MTLGAASRIGMTRDARGLITDDNGANTASFVCAVCLFIFPFYHGALLSSAIAFPLFVMGAAAIVITFLRDGVFKQTKVSLYFLWLIVAVFLVMNFFLLGDHTVFRTNYALFLVVSIILALTGSKSVSWIDPFLKALIVVLLPFAFSTIFFFLNQAAYSQFKDLLYPTTYFANGYKSGLTSHYSYNGAYNTLGALVSAAYAMYVASTKKQRLAWWAVAALFVFVVLLIGKRQNLLFGAAAFVIAYLLSDRPGKIKKLLVTGAVIAIALVVLATFVPAVSASLNRIIETFGSTDLEESTSGRTVIWDAAWAGIQERPLAGYGWGVFSCYLSAHSTVNVAHNEFLDLWYKLGLIGLILVVSCVVITLIKAIGSIRKANALPDVPASIKGFQLVALVVQLYFLFEGFTIGSLFAQPYTFMPYFLTVGIQLSCSFYVSREGALYAASLLGAKQKNGVSRVSAR